MALATYKDLCLDVEDLTESARFWASALGLDARPGSRANVRLAGPTTAHSVWLNSVPEPKAAKLRVHLDVHTTSIDVLTALGASVVDGDSFRWTVMRDPEGAEFCAFVRGEPPAYRLYEISFDTRDRQSLAAWWQAVLGGTLRNDDEGFSWIEAVPNLPFDGLVFADVPEPKTTKNRVHLDMTANDVDAVVAHGATVIREPGDDIDWHVLADPEGNEFCVFGPP